MDNQETMAVIKKFLNGLETIFTNCEEEKNELLEKNSDFRYMDDLITVYNASKLAFAEGIVAMNKAKKEEFIRIVNKAIEDTDLLASIFSESHNLNCLNIEGLIEDELVAPQVEDSYKVFDEAIDKLKQYTSKINIDRNSDIINKIEEYIEYLVAIGSKFDGESLNRDVNNIDFLEIVLDDVDLTDEEKYSLLEYILVRNTELYNEALLARENELESDIELSKDQVSNEMDTYEREDEYSIPEKELLRLEEIIKNPIMFEKIVSAIDEEYLQDIYFDTVDNETLIEINNLAREELTGIMKSRRIGADEALEIFLSLNNDWLINAQEMLSEEEDSIISILTEDEQKELFARATEFCINNQKLLLKIPYSEKQKVDSYMQHYYKDKDNRLTIYRAKQLRGDNKSITRDATYEINTILNIIKRLDPTVEEQRLLISKAYRRINDIFDSYDTAMRPKEEIESLEEEIKEAKKNIFFLMKNKDKSYFEDDMRFDRESKGISRNEYKEVKDNLEYLEENESNVISSVRGTWKYLRKMKVKYLDGYRTSIFYIPTGEKDIIILGVGMINGKDDSFRENDFRAKQSETEIKTLEERLTNEETRKEEIQKSKVVRKRINESFNKNTESALDEALEEMLESDENSSQNEKIRVVKN